jgi:hypothetical protein
MEVCCMWAHRRTARHNECWWAAGKSGFSPVQFSKRSLVVSMMESIDLYAATAETDSSSYR